MAPTSPDILVINSDRYISRNMFPKMYIENKLNISKSCFYASAPATAVAVGMILLDCCSVHPILVNAISEIKS